jgi:hypothetical protein
MLYGQVAAATQGITYFGISEERVKRRTYGQGQLLLGGLTNCLPLYFHSCWKVTTSSLTHLP